jgi:2-hydroxychromene-2-carboxylate isomerase
MNEITFYLDFVSPYALLAFEQLPRSLEGVSYSVRYVPVLFAGMLKHHGQLGPAEIPPKRDWTYRQVLWQAHSLGIEFEMPATHPFNPLPLLRLALACGSGAFRGEISRHVAETVFRHVWRGGAVADDAARLQNLHSQLAPARDVNGTDVKTQLKDNTDKAIAQGVFGVPAFMLDDRIFWGHDSLPMVRDYIDGGDWFKGDGWQRAEAVLAGTVRASVSR